MPWAGWLGDGRGRAGADLKGWPKAAQKPMPGGRFGHVHHDILGRMIAHFGLMFANNLQWLTPMASARIG